MRTRCMLMSSLLCVHVEESICRGIIESMHASSISERLLDWILVITHDQILYYPVYWIILQLKKHNNASHIFCLIKIPTLNFNRYAPYR